MCCNASRCGGQLRPVTKYTAVVMEEAKDACINDEVESSVLQSFSLPPLCTDAPLVRRTSNDDELCLCTETILASIGQYISNA